jgi:hypothetical protein
MAISETQLETWSHQGQTGQFTATYQTLKLVLDSSQSPYANRSCDSFLQGSYANDTNVHGDSDVDIVLRTRDIYYSDTSSLVPDEKANFDREFSPAKYLLSDFKAEVIAWLQKHYSNSVKIGPKAITILGNGTRRDADIVVTAEFRRYKKFQLGYSPIYEEGICFFLPDGTKIENFPKQHSENCTIKHQSTNLWFKRTGRTFKNLRNAMIADGMINAKLAPSYFIEGLCYNAPASQFGGSHTANFIDVLNWLLQADRSKFVCANEQFYLLNDSSRVTWTAAKCSAFLSAAVNYWNR